jgi:dephospho-CoA kinase
MDKKIIAITGGIGAGKSVVSSMLRAMNYPVYDCDENAKRIMDTDAAIKKRLSDAFGEEVIVDGTINRPRLSAIVFKDKEKLKQLNHIVHSSVLNDFQAQAADCDSRLFFVESAIVYQSGIDKIVDEVWLVDAPREVRVERVKRRNGLTESQVVARIESQRAELNHHHDFTIVNDNSTPILPALLARLKQYV